MKLYISFILLFVIFVYPRSDPLTYPSRSKGLYSAALFYYTYIAFKEAYNLLNERLKEPTYLKPIDIIRISLFKINLFIESLYLSTL